MPVLYRSSGYIPPGVDPFPPSIENSEWLDKVAPFIAHRWVLFPTKEEMFKWIEENKIPVDLLEDFKLWKETHKIVVTEEYVEFDHSNDIYGSGLFRNA